MKNIPFSVKDALQKFKIPFAARVHKMLLFFGPSSQKDKAVEEFAELIQALMKYKHNDRGSDEQVVEEIVDAGILLDQLRLMFNVTAEQEREIRDRKISKVEALYYTGQLTRSTK